MAIGHRVREAMAAKERSEDTVLMAAAADMEAAEKSPEEIDADETEREMAPVGAISLTFEQLKELLAGGAKGLSVEQVAEIAVKAAHAGADKVKPKELSTTQVERKSAFNPAGERDHPRPKLKCHMYFGSAPLGSPKEVSTLTHEECVALNALTPGHYRIEKHDGSTRVIEIKGQMNANRQLDRLWILLPEGDDNKNGYPKLVEFARQCCEANRVQPEVVG